ncbi:hypothetical protein D8X55_03990 [Malacoplasma penetrans]|uniref:Transmembrane protein n=1 Tax=Malacoplasma penetrans (strain HF-2) TaxID=272633 RepID=Q8EW43_MALP2|nr:MG_279/MG_280 family protein [Malacoplasma penetrans]RXY96382.1 hypothetical protein D8X55_03990 [Malacoplasma penetrans]BAC44153.1 conserved hypothetical protein [Malacoplasma penetrans HF-2]
MRTLVKILYKSSKFVLFTFGTVLVSASLGAGVVGKMYATESKDILNNGVSSISGLLENVNSELSKINTDDLFNSAEAEIAKIEPIIVNAKDDLAAQKANLNKLIQELEGLIASTTEDSQKKTLEDIKNTLVQVNDSVIGNETDTFSDNKQTCFAILNELVGIVDGSGGIINLDSLKGTLNNLLSTVNSVINPINDFIQPYTNQEKVNSTYDGVTNVLLGVGATILGLIIVGGLLSVICYRRIDGKLVNRFNAKKEIKVHVSKILKKYPNIHNGLSNNGSTTHLFKLRLPLILKNLGLWPAYIFGGLFFGGLLAGGVAATTQKDFVSNTLTTGSKIISDINAGATNVNNEVNNLYTNVFDTTNNPNSLMSQFNSSLQKLKDMQNKLNDLNSSGSSNIDNNTLESIKNTLNTVIGGVESINKSVNDQTGTIDSIKSQVNDLIGPDGSVTSTLTEIENTINRVNNPDSKEWEYYDLVSQILIIVGASVLGIMILSSILMLIFFKRIDGVALPRSAFRKKLAAHLDKIFKKYPKLWNHFQRGDHLR